MTTFIANFDFEYQLIGKENLSMRKLDYLFLWLADAKDNLVTQNCYSQKFLNYISLQRGEIPSINKPSIKKNFWWGDLDNLKRSQELNSKINFYQWLLAQDIKVPSIQFNLTEKRDEKRFIYKKEFGFSGRNLGENIWLEVSLLNRKRDFSYVFVPKKGYFLLEHTIAKDLSWKGVKVCSFEEPLMLKLLKKWQEDHQAYGPSSLDFFYYEDECENKVFAHEINYRKTMGSILISLRERFPDYSCLGFMAKKEPFLVLSPQDHRRKLYLY